MKNQSVAVLDIRSDFLTFLIGGRGVNGTFVFRGSESLKYEGYGTHGFYDVQSFSTSASRVIRSVLSSYDGMLKTIYISVPAPFIGVRTKWQTMSFAKRRKITEAEIEALYAAGLNELVENRVLADESAMYFSIGDNRRYFSVSNVVGVKTALLQGALCYYFLNEEFYQITQKLFSSMGFSQIKYLPQSLSTAAYLLPAKTREGYATMLDIGYTSSSAFVVYGGGIVHEACFDAGIGSILVGLMEEFGVDYEKAEEILSAADVSGGMVQKGVNWTDREGVAYSVQKINEVIKCCLDQLCEKTDEFFEKYYGSKKISGDASNPLYLTGEGVQEIRGVSEHTERRLCRVTRAIYPEIPYFDKSGYSSRISALNAALEKTESAWGLRKLLNIFGGNKK